MNIKDFIEKFAEAIEIENVEGVIPTTEFKELEEWSSLSVMLTIAFFDDEFEKQIGDIDINQATTIQDLYDIATT